MLKPSPYIKSQLLKDTKWQEIVRQAEQNDKLLDTIEDKLKQAVSKNQLVKINQKRIQRISEKKSSQADVNNISTSLFTNGTNSQNIKVHQVMNGSTQHNSVSTKLSQKSLVFSPFNFSINDTNEDKGLNVLTQSFNSTTINENTGYMWSGISKIAKRQNISDDIKNNDQAKSSPIRLNYSSSINLKNGTLQLPGWTLDRFELKEKLGCGQFSTVYKARDKYTDFTVAIKVISRATMAQNRMFQQILQEIKLHSYVNHPGILKLFGFFSDQEKLYIILEFSPLGDLFSFLTQKKKIDEQLASVFIRQVCEVLAYLHKETIIHRDIKPENILLFTNNNLPQAKVADFGLCARSTTRRYTLCGTSEYGAPEIKNRYGYGTGVDIWSVGILAYELTCGNVPQLQNNKVTFPSHMSQSLQDFISSCLNYDTSKRINADDALKHLWITRYNKLGLEQKDLVAETSKIIK